MHKKILKKICFCDKYIWIVYIEFSLLRREYLSSAVNALTKSLQSLHITASDFFQLNDFHSDERIW